MTTARPILFSAPMIQALLAGRKTQTRRIAKFKPLRDGLNMSFSGLSAIRLRTNGTPDGVWLLQSRGRSCWEERSHPLKCPYGVPGDFLWVRETWGHTGQGVWKVADVYMANDGKLVYRADADDGTGGWFPSIHMPRAFSRLTLELTEVRVERLRDISEADAIAEGIAPSDKFPDRYMTPAGDYAVPVVAYQRLWERINGKDAWDSNPWVWCISFDVHKTNVDAYLKQTREAA